MRFGWFGIDITVGEEVPHPDDLAEEHAQLDQTNNDGDYDRLCHIEMLMAKHVPAHWAGIFV